MTYNGIDRERLLCRNRNPTPSHWHSGILYLFTENRRPLALTESCDWKISVLFDQFMEQNGQARVRGTFEGILSVVSPKQICNLRFDDAYRSIYGEPV